MAPTPEALLGDAPLQAAVSALAERNRHHLERMDDQERAEAVATWREIAMAVLVAAGAALDHPAEPAAPAAAAGRAVIVLEDSGPEEVAVHASFFPQLEDLGNGQVGATPAQATALDLLDGITQDPGADLGPQ